MSLETAEKANASSLLWTPDAAVSESVSRPSAERRRAPVVWLGAASLAAAATVVYGPVLTKLVYDWWTIPDYSHGLLCVPLALALAYSRRRELASTPASPHPAGLAGSLAAVLLLLVGTLGAELFLTRLSLLLFAVSAVVFLFGWRHIRLLSFPIALLALAIPLPALIVTQLTLPLQLAASAMAEVALTAIEVPVLREGNVLVLPEAMLQVAEACSGLRSFVALAVTALVVARFTDPRVSVRAAIVLAALPITILVNGLRVTATAAGTYYYGKIATDGFVHEATGAATFLIASGLIILSARAISSVRRRAA